MKTIFMMIYSMQNCIWRIHKITVAKVSIIQLGKALQEWLIY